MTTEATYPYAVGGVSSWCELLLANITDVRWQILPIVAAGTVKPAFELPAHAELVGRIELWAERLPRGASRLPRDLASEPDIPGTLVRELIGWGGDMRALTEALVSCRAHGPRGIRAIFRRRSGWEGFLSGLRSVLLEKDPEAGTLPDLDVLDAARLYQTLYWLAQTATAATPETDVLHVTAAGWAGVPAIVHKALHDTPLILTEHGVYVREAYLAAVRSQGSAGARFIATRLTRGLARLAYSAADLVLPVTGSNAQWEEELGVDPERIRVIYNGVDDGELSPLPRTGTVISIGRLDPLKDIHTMLRVAKQVVERTPQARFLHYGPPTQGQEAYARSCYALHAKLGLGERFRFMGPTNDPIGALEAADLVILTSISEGLPLAILEGMSKGRAVVATRVGGVAEVVRGAGFVAAPGDVHGLASAVTTLVRNPDLARRLGERAQGRVGRVFARHGCVQAYRRVYSEIIAERPEAPALAADLQALAA